MIQLDGFGQREGESAGVFCRDSHDLQNIRSVQEAFSIAASLRLRAGDDSRR
jgi:hypothetical protein